jgi:phosphatidylserine/phosphatidylglycerophosphate/cardiolipin synthase-like enzyme
VLSGSFNFTKAPEENNPENLLLIRDVKLAAQFEANWQKHFAHAEYYTGK